ncbi:tape measure protein [Acinetobacter sp. YH01005]|uniref:tape measure protein n=1 Tax=Acinetobacter sp. YH01005 TaxID=2601021 RepID=UPI0015D264C3|nr:tape measure protein [Acinetobacter sp. YH01005]
MATKLGTLTLDLIAKTAGFTEPMKKAGDTAERESKRIENSAGSAIEMIKGLGVTALAGFTVGSVISMADEYTQMAAQIRNATSSQQEYNQVQEHLLQTANTTYRPLKEAQQVYLDVGGALKAYGETTERALRITDSLSFSFTHNATAADKAASATDAYMKSIYSGKVSGDAWISILSAVPSIVGDLSKSLNKSEADILSMGNAGKLSTKDLNNALDASREKSEALANSMENSLADGFTVLSNAVTDYLGKANESTSATGMMAGALGILAGNLETVANVAMLGGVAYLTKRIAEQSVAVREAIIASTARAAAAEAEAASQARLLALEVQRSRQAAAQTLTELNLARAEMNSATTRQERAAATMRLTQAEIAHNIAMKQSAAAVATQVAAESELTAARTASSRALALVGGPIGAITIGVTALAAGYMYLSNNSNESTKSLRENNEAVGDAIVKYRELNGIQRDAQMAAERQKLEELNEAYRKASAELMVYASNMGNMGEIVTESQVELSKLFAEYKKTGDLDAFNTSVQNSSRVSQDAKDKTANFAKAVYEAGTEAKTQKDFIAQLSGELNGTANAGHNAATGVRNLASALNEVNTKLSSDVFSAKLQNAFEKQGKSSQSAARWTEVYNENAKNGFKGVTIEQKKMLDQLDAVDKQREARQKAAQAAASNSAKSSKAALSQQAKDAKEAERLKEQQANARERIAYEFATREMQIEKDLAAKIEEIRKAKFSVGDTSGFIQNATQRASLEKQLYIEILAADLNEWQETATEKLDRQVKINSLRIQLDSQMNDELKEQALKSLADKSNAEIEKIRIAQSKQLLEAKRHWISVADYAKEYYALVREEILNTAEYSPEMKQSLVKEANFNQGLESNAEREQVWGDYKSMMGLDKSPYQEDMDLLAKARKHMLLTEEEYQQQRLAMQMSYGAQYGADFAGMMMGLVDSSSSAYAILGGVQKGAALFSTALNSYQAISAAWASSPFPYNLPAVAMATMETGLLQAAVSALSPVGYATGGHITGKGTGTSDEIPIMASNGEFMMRTAAVNMLGLDTLNFMNQTGRLPNAYADGGSIALDAPKVLNMQSPSISGYLQQASHSQKQIIDNQIRVIMVKDEDEAKDMLYSADGEKAFLYHMKRNRSKV